MIDFIEQFECIFEVADGRLGMPVNISASTKKLFNLHKTSSMDCIREFPPDFYAAMHDCLPYLTEYNSYVFTYELSDSLWRITMHVSSSRLLVVGMRSWELRHLQNLNNIDSSIPFPRSELTGTMLLQKDAAGDFVIESLSPALSGSFAVLPGDALAKLLRQTSYIHSPLIFNQVLTNNLVAAFFTTVEIDGEKRYYNFELLPLSHDMQKLVTSVYEVNQATFFKYQMVYNHTIDDYNMPVDSVGLAKIRFLRQNSFTVLTTNYRFNQLISMDDLDEIANSKIFDEVYVNRYEAHSRFCFKKSTVPLIVSIVPLDTNELGYIFVAYEREYNSQINIGSLLTKREMEVFELLISGNIYKEIASILDIAEGTVKKMVSNIYKKVGVDNKYELIKLMTSGDGKS